MRNTCLSLIFLLLAIAGAQAQSNTKDPEVLRGMRGVRLTISFGRADAMDAVQRPAVQKMLQEETEAKFTKAGIHLLKFAGEIDKEPGSPHFQVTITLDKLNGYVYPVVTESRLFQNVRLSRAPSVERSVSMWETHSVGVYDLKDFESLRLQVGNEVDEFIKAYLIANPQLKQASF